MSDIVERLRRLADQSSPGFLCGDELCEAADEIALTRTVLANAVELNKAQADEIEKLRAQVVSLTSSLDVGVGTGKKTP